MFPVHQQTGEHQCLKYAVSIARHSLPKLPKFQIKLIALKRHAKRRGEKNGKRKKRKIDQDYKDNQYKAQKAWADRNPEYWRLYRKKIIDSQNSKSTTQSNHEAVSKKTRPRNPNGQELKDKWILLKDGIFSLRVIDKPNSKMDVWIVEITRIIKD